MNAFDGEDIYESHSNNDADIEMQKHFGYKRLKQEE